VVVVEARAIWQNPIGPNLGGGAATLSFIEFCVFRVEGKPIKPKSPQI
jgi:hypothetical protein